MNDLSRKILESYQVRMKKKQKTAFIELLKNELPVEMTIEKTYFGGRNLIFGDPNKAKYILTAHYDTAPVLPFPNFLTPKNIPVYLGYMLLLCAGIFVILFAAVCLTALIFNDPAVGSMVYGLFLIVMFGWMFFGKPNKHTANDNTSGVITLLEAMQDPAVRENCCIVLFDLEEMGLFGSMHFAGKHKNLKDKPLLNFDCVGEGDHIMFVIPKPATPVRSALESAFQAENGKELIFTKSATTFYPSDQSNFKCGIGVAAFKKKKLFGYYIDRIHTRKDTVCDEVNLKLLVDGIKRLADTKPE